MRTLKAGEHQLVFTKDVTYLMGEDTRFSKFVYNSLLRFNRGDWGDVSEDSWLLNDAGVLNNGEYYGDMLAIYEDFSIRYDASFVDAKIFITRQTVMEDGTQAITVLFPYER